MLPKFAESFTRPCYASWGIDRSTKSGLNKIASAKRKLGCASAMLLLWRMASLNGVFCCCGRWASDRGSRCANVNIVVEWKGTVRWGYCGVEWLRKQCENNKRLIKCAESSICSVLLMLAYLLYVVVIKFSCLCYALAHKPRCTLCHETSSNGNIFRVTGHLCGEFTGHR